MKALIITASIVLSALVLVIGWLAFSPGPDASEPQVTLAVTPPPKHAPGPRTPAAGEEGSGIDLPPGFGITGQPGAPSPQLQSAPPPPPGSQQQTASSGAAPSSATAPAGQQAPEAVAMQAPSPPQAPVAAPQSEMAPVTLVSAPVPDLVEESQYGPLPKVAPDGRRPLEVYARPSAYAEKASAATPPRIAVLINGMGLSDAATADAIKALPPPISVAYGAYSRNLQDWVTRARAAGHEVLLEVPLEPLDYPANDPGPHTLLTTLPPEENMKRLEWLMSRFTGYVGITNVMGAKFEATQESFLPVLEEIKARGLLFLDDGTALRSTAGQIASALGLDYAVASVQIDAVATAPDIAKALSQLESVAKERGIAIGIASAKPATVKQLAAWAEQLQGKGVVLIPISAAVRSQRQS
jgi:uncharacterized protein